nr:hypothetical protein [Tanacetum cinerariifolium]
MLRAFPMSLIGVASRCLRNEPTSSITTWEILKEKFLRALAEMSQHDIQEVILFTRDWREINKVNKKVYVGQVGCELCKGPHYNKDCPLKEEGKILEEAYYTQFDIPFQQGGQYKAAAPGFYQRNNRNPSYQERGQTMKEPISKFMAESAKRH